MGKSSLKIKIEKEFTKRQLDRIIEMTWEDLTPFEAIEFQFEISEKDVIKLMGIKLKEASFKHWRKRVNNGIIPITT